MFISPQEAHAAFVFFVDVKVLGSKLRKTTAAWGGGRFQGTEIGLDTGSVNGNSLSHRVTSWASSPSLRLLLPSLTVTPGSSQANNVSIFLSGDSGSGEGVKNGHFWKFPSKSIFIN